MKNKFLFINPLTHSEVTMTVYPPVGILSMAACLKESGYDVEYIDIDVYRYSSNIVCELINKIQPDVIGFSINVSQVSHSVNYIAQIKINFPDIPIILGGPYVTSVKEKIFKDFPEVVYAIIGEGEYAVIEFMEFLFGRRDISKVNNLLYKKKGGSVVLNNVFRIKNLDELPIPDYSIIPDISKYSAPEPSIASPSIAIMCTRGCPYNCSFCSSPYTWQRKLTVRSVESVIREIKYLKNNYSVKEIFFQDDTLNARTKWFNNLCDRIVSEDLHKEIFFKAPFRANRELISNDILSKARNANFWMIFYGVESGNQEMLNSMNKAITIDAIKRAFKLTRRNGLISYASFMIGNLGETKKTVQDSIRLAKKIKPDFGGFAIAAPFPGSELYKKAKELNLITQDDFTKYQFGDSILKTEKLQIDDIERLALYANNQFSKITKTFGYNLLTKNNYFLKMINNRTHKSKRNQLLLNKQNVDIEVCIIKSYGELDCNKIKIFVVEIYNKCSKPISSFMPHPIHISYHWKSHSGTHEIFDGLRSSINPQLNINEKRLVEVNVQAPQQRGKYILEITLVQEQNFWFEDHMPNLPLKIKVEVV